MSDDRELVERLAAIDATPRAGWVAELRAHLDAAWETEDSGYLDSLRTTTVTLVENEPTPSEPNSARRWSSLIAAAAAVVLVGVVFVVFGRDDATPADQPAPAVTVPPTTLPRALVDPTFGRFEPGTYFVDEVDGLPTARIFVTIGAGWRDIAGPSDKTVLSKFGTEHIGVLNFSRPSAVFSDACRWRDGYVSGPLNVLDALVTALSEQGGWADVTAPSDISVDGYPGKTFQRTAPSAAVMSDCSIKDAIRPRTWPEPTPGSWPAFRSWQDRGEMSAGEFYEPGEIETLFVLDIDGTVVVISTRSYPEVSAAARAEFAAVLDSIHIDRE